MKYIKSFSKAFALLMIAVMVLGMLAGCGNQNGSSNQTSSEASSISKNQASSEASSISTKEHMNLSWMIPTQQKISISETPVVKEIMKKFNVDFTLTELPPQDQHPQKVKLLIASGDIPDIMSWVKKDDANQYGPQGAFMELSQYLDTKLPDLKKLLDSDPNGKYNAFTTDGKLYRCPDYNDVSLPFFDFGYMKGEFDAIGVTKLDTWSEVYDALKKIKAKYPDSYPLIGRGKEIGSDSVKMLTIMSFTQGLANPQQNPGFDYNSKQFIFGPAAPGFKEAIEWFKKLYDEKLLDPEYLTTDMNGIKSKLQNKKGFMLMDFVGGLSGVDEVQKLINNGLYPMELPGVEGKERVLGYQPNKIGTNGTIISGKLSGDKLDIALAILNYLYSDDCNNLLYWNPDVTSIKDGQKIYTDAMYTKDPKTIDTYLPWSLNATFRVNYETVTKPGSPYADYKNKVFMDPKNENRFVPLPTIPFTADETQNINAIWKTLNDIYESTIDQFIMGKKPMSQWDAFINEMKTKGGDELVKIYNDAYTKYFK